MLQSTDITKSISEIKPTLLMGVHFCAIICRWLKMMFSRTPCETKVERKLVAIKENANLRKKFSLAQFLGIKTYLDARHPTVWGAPQPKKVLSLAEFPAGFLPLSFYPLKVHEDKL